MKLVIASNNAKKRQEIATILGTLNIELVDPNDTIAVDVIEDQDSFADNARKKSEAFAQANHCAALADDSGLCVDVLNHAPGIYSARFAGIDASDQDNNIALLEALSEQSKRSAHFVCAVHLTIPESNQSFSAIGSVDGEILHTATGVSGFGYDPLFFCPELNKTFADATAEEKSSVSHRGRALRALAAQLNQSQYV
ncbi:MAG: RdgB/HAM1 family non-canonical purine NTP pyrophosphatase [Mariprofundaceae bacterium]|nr:RdgB/HAM1 family non-canonical purine NTP pyrophosphatase [Mariprofundaceae bacterium]